MAYFNGYPATYTPYYTPVQQPTQQVQTQGGVIWVSGEAGAKSYLVAPNNSVVLFDSEGQTIYIKSADATGMPSIKVLDYTVRETGRNTQNTAPVIADDKLSTFATKDEIRAISDRIKAIADRVDKMEGKANE